MNQNEKVEYLIDYFKSEFREYVTLEFQKEDRKKYLRALINLRMPQNVPQEVLEIQDDYLQTEAREKGIVSIEDIPTVKAANVNPDYYGNKLSLWQGDITRLKVDAIVNAANSQLLGCFVPCHQCIDNAIHSQAGLELRNECNEYRKTKIRELEDLNLSVDERKDNISIKRPGNWKRSLEKRNNYQEPTGSAMITAGYNLPSKYVIHTVGPIVSYRVTKELREDLRNCYRSCLEVALENSIRTIAFCCISTGEFHFPNQDAAEIAVETVLEFLKNNNDKIDRVIFNVFKDLDLEIYKKILDMKL